MVRQPVLHLSLSLSLSLRCRPTRSRPLKSLIRVKHATNDEDAEGILFFPTRPDLAVALPHPSIYFLFCPHALYSEFAGRQQLEAELRKMMRVGKLAVGFLPRTKQ